MEETKEAPAAVHAAAARFDVAGPVESIREQGGGHINSSYVVTCATDGGRSVRYLLQRINTTVFTRPELVMANVRRVTEHLCRNLEGSPDLPRRALRLVPTRDGEPWVRATDADQPWRCFEFVEDSVCLLEPRTPDDAREAAKACGRFLADMSSYDGERMDDVLPRFHDTPLRYEQLDAAIARGLPERLDDARLDLAFAEERRAGAGSVLEALASGAIPVRVAHNDAKISNVLFDAATGRGLCVIDLDTVMETSSLFDFGDLVRSMASGRPEDERDLGSIEVQRPVFVALVDGFLDGFGGVMTRAERELLVEGARIMALQQGVRFLADHLVGDVYFRVHRTGQNLDRARAQFRLVDRLEARRGELGAVAASR
ncbi:MAG: aminoglycoside phosphotransferase family protein [Planctomycetota bacterium]